MSPLTPKYLYTQLFQFLSDPVFVISEKREIVDCNEATIRNFGYTREEFLALIPEQFIHPDHFEEYQKGMKELMADRGILMESVFIRQDGSSFPVEVHAREIVYNDEFCIVTVVRDTTRRKRVEDALIASEKELTIRDRINSVFLTISDEKLFGGVLQVILDVLNSKYGVFGYINEDGSLVCPSMKRDIRDEYQVPEKEITFPRERWGDIWGRAMDEGKTLCSNEPCHVPEGHIPITRALDMPIIHQGIVIGYLFVGNKTSDYNEDDKWLLETLANHIAPLLSARLERSRLERERKKVEEALREAELRYRALFKEMPLGIGLATPEGEVLDSNRSMQRITGYSLEDFEHINLEETYVNPEERAVLLKRLQDEGSVHGFEVKLKKKDGTPYPARLTVNRLTLGDEDLLMTIVEDISEDEIGGEE